MEANYGKQFPRHRRDNLSRPDSGCDALLPGTEPGFDRDNLITVAWAGVVNSDPPMVSVSIRPSRHSYAQILQSGAFCLNLIDQPLCRAADFCGVKSGRDIDKFAEMRLHAREIEGFPRAGAG